MPDKFIDNLFNELSAERQRDLTEAAGHHDRRQAFEVAKQQWWQDFIDVLGQKVGAWNEKDPLAAPVNFTKRDSGGAHIWHKNAEVELRLYGGQVLANARIGSAALREEILIELEDTGDGHVRATSRGETFTSPTTAAEKVIAPLFAAAFRRLS
jgi:hypothetical protein